MLFGCCRSLTGPNPRQYSSYRVGRQFASGSGGVLAHPMLPGSLFGDEIRRFEFVCHAGSREDEDGADGRRGDAQESAQGLTV